MPRLVLVTGDAPAIPAVAAASAVHAAGRGERTLLLAADDPHRLLDEQLDTRLTAAEAEVRPGLWACRLDEQQAFRQAVAGLDGRLRTGYDLLGVDPLEPDELTALPGTRALALLHALRGPADARPYDQVVVAAPPPAELTAALALPEQLDRYLARLLPEQRQAARALRPLLAAVAGMPAPAEWLHAARGWAATELAATRSVIESPHTSVRLAVSAAACSVPGLRRAAAGLALFGHRLDAVAVHGALPRQAADSADPWLAEQAAAERDRLAAIDLGVPLLTADRSAHEVDRLAAQLFGDRPAPVPAERWPWTAEDRRAEDGVLVWRLAAPGADRADLELVRRGDELVVGLGPYRRILPLPGALRRCTVAGAALRDGELTLRFAPDPALWPERG
jgi:arsenite-transporting ATPase